jgi:phosphoglycerate dehydrogenase-like enzyme
MSAASDAVVLVTARSFGGSRGEFRDELEAAVREVRWNELGRPLDATELREAVADVDGAIAGVDRFDAAIIEAAPRLRVIARHGTGTDTVDLTAAARRGIVVTNTPGANADAVAELAIGLMLALARGIPQADRQVRRGTPDVRAGVQLAGRTIGLIGVGRVGQAVARRGRGLGCEVLGFDPALDDAEVRAAGATPSSTAEVVEAADFLSLHVPVTDATRDMVDAAFLSGMKPGAFLVNTARGELVVEEDLLRALEESRLAGAALDMLRADPPPREHPLLQREDVILTPHAGAHTEEARAAMARLALDDLLAVLDGRPPRHPVEPAVGSQRG